MKNGERAHRRHALAGEAFWSAGRREGSCTLHNISLGGAEVNRPNLPLIPGAELILTLVLDGAPLPAVHAIVVRTASRSVAFRFVRPTTEFAERLQQAIRVSERT